jgi:hypothetical protein
MTDMTAHARTYRYPQHQKRVMKPWQIRTVAILVAAIAVALAVYAAAASYESVSHLAASRGVPLPQLNPLGIDGGLAGVILFSIALYWVGTPIRWLRFIARLFAAGTIAANAAAGWPDPVSVGLRIAAPVLFIVLVEATYSLLVRRDEETEGIPVSRWLLAPRSTFGMWRRMKLWRIRSYARALDLELARRQAIMKLAGKYGAQAWEQKAPQDLVWMLTEGVKMAEALGQVAELTAPPEPELRPGTPPRNRNRKAARNSAARKSRKPVAASAPEAPADADLDTEARALQILADEPGISGSQLGLRLGKSDRYGRELIKKLAAAAPGPEAQ